MYICVCVCVYIYMPPDISQIVVILFSEMICQACAGIKIMRILSAIAI